MKLSRQGTRDRCDHAGSVTVYSAGVQRVTCQSCGNVSFQFRNDLTGSAERGAFARGADDQQSRTGVGHV